MHYPEQSAEAITSWEPPAPSLVQYIYKSSINWDIMSVVKNLPTNARDERDRVRSLGWEDPLKEEIATHSSSLALIIPRTENSGRLQSMG